MADYTFTCNGTATGTGTIQQWTVPQSAAYRIRAVGGQGGDAQQYTGKGGKGADMAGDFDLTAGDVLYILVGQKGINPSTARSAPGGGGTFVVLNNVTPLVVAGGGGGGYSADGVNARTTNSGTGNGSTNNAGGAGFNTNGTGDSWVSGSNVAYAYVNGGKGAGPGSYSNYGGYGGGGCTHGYDGTYYCGGGGYEGGNTGSTGATGAGSYNTGTNVANTIYTGTGNGFVEITALNEPPTTPTGVTGYQDGPTGNLILSWTFNDPDLDPQGQYQVRIRTAD